MSLPLEVAYPTDEEIKIHLAAGRYYGRKATCGNKIKWPTFKKAYESSIKMTEKYNKPLEAYPCFFCSPDTEHNAFYWHTGRTMTEIEWETFSKVADKILEQEVNTLSGGQTLRTHPISQCQGQFCCIHNPSQHHMVVWPMIWRSDRRIMERVCPHGIGHPDPDDANYRASTGDNDSVHGCDGCC